MHRSVTNNVVVFITLICTFVMQARVHHLVMQ